MGQALSRLRKGHFASPAGSLLNTPVKVFLLISDRLSPDALAALSLTCKPFYLILKERIQLNSADRNTLLLLLEKDLGDKLYYCHFCSRLHPFSPSWTPVDSYLRARKIQNCCYECCPVLGQAFSLSKPYHYGIGYHHARLVMNRHLFGAPRGLPLDHLHRRFVELSPRSWTQDWSARIVDNELFLRAIHVFYGQDSVCSGAAIGHEDHFICPHIMTAMPLGYKVYFIDEIPELKDHHDHRLIPCRDILRSCPRCLTDYQITIERAEGCERPLRTTPTIHQKAWVSDGNPHEAPHAAGWQITIVTYHQVGSCRSPQDWKWKTLTFGLPLLKSPRSEGSYPSGAVIRKWQQSL
ncbi:hypothetical protein F4678DRAFT_473973 [Xylaria arbuscula]|nr:hypothetical protein F4678DRAFT_473973 [Xylaria arbuscula]